MPPPAPPSPSPPLRAAAAGCVGPDARDDCGTPDGGVGAEDRGPTASGAAAAGGGGSDGADGGLAHVPPEVPPSPPAGPPPPPPPLRAPLPNYAFRDSIQGFDYNWPKRRQQQQQRHEDTHSDERGSCPEKQRQHQDQLHPHPQWLREDGCPSPLSNLRVLSGAIVTDLRVKVAILVIIIINCAMMGLETFDFVSDDPLLLETFEAFDVSFLVVYTAELALQFVYRGWDLFRSGWLTLDFLVVASSWFFSELEVIQALRIVRALRIATHVKGLQDLVTALINVIPRVLAVFGLLVLVFYVFAVMFTQLFKGYYEDGYTSRDYFSRLDVTLLTLFQIMTLDSWSDITHELMTGNSLAWVPMLIFVIISAFMFINLFIAVTDAVAELRVDEAESHIMETIASMDIVPGSPSCRCDCAGRIARLEGKVDGLTRLVEGMMARSRGAGPGFFPPLSPVREEWVPRAARPPGKSSGVGGGVSEPTTDVRRFMS